MPSFDEPDRDEILTMRGVLVEELEEWFGYGYSEHSAPPWFWFVFDDAGLGLADVCSLLEEPATLPQYDLQALAERMSREATEQVENANDEQVACYSMARAAWVESP